jgi:hypothetical protein
MPLLMMFKRGRDMIECRIHPPPNMTYQHYGLLVCDLVRHIANAFEVTPDLVWEWGGQRKSESNHLGHSDFDA